MTNHRIEVDRMSQAELQDQLDEIKATQMLILEKLIGHNDDVVLLDEECLVSGLDMMHRLKISRATLERRRKAGELSFKKVGRQYRYDWCAYLNQAS